MSNALKAYSKAVCPFIMCAQGPKSTGRLCRFPTQLEQFPVNAQRSPGRILGDHSKDQGANLLLTRLRPPTRRNLEIHVQYKRNPARSQFTTVRGATKTRGFLHPDQNVLSATQNSLCRAVIECEAVARAKRAVADGEPSFRGRGPSGVSSKAANWGHFKTGQRKWLGTVKSCTRS